MHHCIRIYNVYHAQWLVQTLAATSPDSNQLELMYAVNCIMFSDNYQNYFHRFLVVLWQVKIKMHSLIGSSMLLLKVSIIIFRSPASMDK